jgi:hypothetical protein
VLSGAFDDNYLKGSELKEGSSAVRADLSDTGTVSSSEEKVWQLLPQCPSRSIEFDF